MKVSIIIPAHNEEKRIKKTLEAYTSYFNKIRSSGLKYEIIVVINGTTDSTERIVKTFSKKNKEIKYLNLKRGGKGYAVIEGFKHALKGDNDLIGFVDADMATSPEAYHSLINGLNSADGVIASRYVNGAVVSPKQTIQRQLVSRIFNILIRSLFLFPFKDTQCGAKVFTHQSLKKVVPSLSMSQWAFDVELLYIMRKKGFTIKEEPTVWADKEYSKINFLKAGPFMALGIIRLRILNSPFRRFIRIYDKFITHRS